jgi:hypothetical protein
MSPCICIDDSNAMFRVIKGAHYWQPVVEKSIKVGDVIYFEKSDAGVYLSLTDNKDASFIFFSQRDFDLHFIGLSELRDSRINNFLK